MKTFIEIIHLYLGGYAHKFFSFDFLTYIKIKRKDIDTNKMFKHEVTKKYEDIKDLKQLQELFNKAEKEMFTSDKYYSLSEHDRRIFNVLYSREYNFCKESVAFYLEYIEVINHEKNGKISTFEATQEKVSIINKMTDFKKVLQSKNLMLLALVEMKDNLSIDLVESIIFEKNLIPNRDLIKNIKNIPYKNQERFFVYLYERLLDVKEYEEIDSEVDEYKNLPVKKSNWDTKFNVKGMLEDLFKEDNLV